MQLQCPVVGMLCACGARKGSLEGEFVWPRDVGAVDGIGLPWLEILWG